MNPFQFHPEALLDLVNIWNFVAADSADAADRIAQDILAAVESAAQFPGKGHRRADLTSRPSRFLYGHDYLIAYAPEESPLLVLAVLHGRRTPRIMAAVLRGRL